nr:AAA family ATPase [Piscinibacter lacus]
MDVAFMLRNPPPPLDEVLPGLLAKTVGLGVGPGAVSKTMLMLQVAIAKATGTPLFGGAMGGLVGGTPVRPQQPERVVLVLAEELAEVVWGRLQAIASVQLGGLDIDPDRALALLSQNLVIHSLAGEEQVNLLSDGLEKTAAGDLLLQACRGARLVVLDPIREFHNADENDSAAMGALVRHIKRYARVTGAAWLLVHHTSRAAALNGYGDTADAGRGSTALTNAVRWQLNLSRPTRQTAMQHGLRDGALHQHVLLDIPKANYIATPETMLLRRGPHGVLLPASEVA